MVFTKHFTRYSTYQDEFAFYRLFPLVGIILMFVDAPFGRFTSNNKKSILNYTVDGKLAWIIMELPSPITLLYVYYTTPLTSGSQSPWSISHPAFILVCLYVVHYMNRAIISPLRTPTRSRSHITVPMAAILFNLLNGSLIGAFLSSGRLTFENMRQHAWGFCFGVCLFLFGMAGNILHDEVLLSIRKDKDRKKGDQSQQGEHKYAIPVGYLYRWISYPNYLCEWIEWTGFALATSCAIGQPDIWNNPTWWFVINEIAVMLPRAISGHQWYHEKFDDYPKERKAVIPYIL